MRPRAPSLPPPNFPSGSSPTLLEGVRFAYPTGFALGGIDLRIEQGEMVAVLGPNGSGKTTLLKLMLGMLHPDTGVVRFKGRVLGAVRGRELARSIAMVPQET